MSNNGSDNESNAGDRPESSEDEDRSPNPLPSANPSNIPDDAPMGDPDNARRPTKKPKLAARNQPADRTLVPEGMYIGSRSNEIKQIDFLLLTFKDDFGDVQAPSTAQNIDQRPDGGFIDLNRARPKGQKMKWTAERDRRLLIFGLGRDIAGRELQAIADSFPERPTQKAVQERLTKLRAQTRQALKDTGIFDIDAVRQQQPQPQPQQQQQQTSASSSQSTSLPAPTPTQRPPAGRRSRPSTTAASTVADPSTSAGLSTPRRSQQTRQRPVATQPPAVPHTPGMPQSGLLSHQHALGPAGAPTYHSPHTPGSGLTGYQYPSSRSSSRSPLVGGPSYQPYQPSFYPSQQGGSTYQGAAAPTVGLGLGTPQYLTPYAMPPLASGQQNLSSLPPSLPMQAPSGGTVDPPSQSSSQAEDDGTFDLARSEREYEEMKARREAEKRGGAR